MLQLVACHKHSGSEPCVVLMAPAVAQHLQQSAPVVIKSAHLGDFITVFFMAISYLDNLYA